MFIFKSMYFNYINEYLFNSYHFENNNKKFHEVIHG